jgi:hypothetical protein
MNGSVFFSFNGRDLNNVLVTTEDHLYNIIDNSNAVTTARTLENREFSFPTILQSVIEIHGVENLIICSDGQETHHLLWNLKVH